MASTPGSVDKDGENVDFFDFLMGLSLLCIALVISCLLGQFQQHIYSKFGKHWEEGLFYMHILGLPVFLFFYSDIQKSIIDYNQSTPISVGKTLMGIVGMKELESYLSLDVLSDVHVPELWFYLVLNTCTQFVCISGVSKLTSMTSSVSVNLILAIRKFVSLILSVLIFQNPFTWQNWLGAILVFAGSMIYSTN